MSLEALTWAFKQKLTPGEKIVLLALADYADDEAACWPKISTLADKASLSVRTVRERIRDLESAGLIETQNRARPDGSQTSNQYVLVGMAPPAESAAPPAAARRPPRQTAAAHEPSVDPSLNTSPTPSADDVFDALWQAWPNAKAKKPALESWRRVWKKYPHGRDELVTAIVGHAAAHVRHTPPQFVPMLSTFLNQERWTDPLPVSREQGAYQADPGLQARSAAVSIPSGYLPIRDDMHGHVVGYRRVDPSAAPWAPANGLPVQL